MPKRGKNLRVVQDDEVLDLDKYWETEKNIDEQINAYRRKRRRMLILGIVAILVIITATYLVVHFQTYTKIKTVQEVETSDVTESGYQQFAAGVLRYSKDGISLLNKSGDVIFNQPYQMRNPIVTVSESAAAVADKEGNEVYIFNKEGLIGEVKTSAPIEKITVSEQGILCALLKGDMAPSIICYDTKGAVLVEHKSTIATTGYPVDARISEDGKGMIVSYLHIKEKQVESKIGYYSFAGENDKSDKVGIKEVVYEGELVPTVGFLRGDISFHVGEKSLSIYRGITEPTEVSKINFDLEISSVASDSKYIAVLLKDKTQYEVRLFGANGKEKMRGKVKNEYSRMKVVDGQVILYDGTNMCIVLKDGVERFVGEADKPILEVYPLLGVNKYAIINSSGMETVRLTK